VGERLNRGDGRGEARKTVILGEHKRGFQSRKENGRVKGEGAAIVWVAQPILEWGEGEKEGGAALKGKTFKRERTWIRDS